MHRKAIGRRLATGFAVPLSLLLCGGLAPGPARPQDEGQTIRGEIVFPAPVPSFKDATVNISLEVVTELDVKAGIAARLSLLKISQGGPRPAPLRFALGEFRLDPDNEYNLRVHIDVDRDGQVSRGDFVSYESTPVAAGKPAGAARIPVKVQQVR